MPAIENRGVRIFFEDLGSGTPLVLGHSFLCSGEMWRPQLKQLAERARIINIDCRGHGNSGRVEERFTLYDMVVDVLAVLDHLGIDRATWAGLSIGGMVALRAALMAPQRVSRLILLDTHAGAEEPYKKLKYRAMALGIRVVGIEPFLPAVIPLFFGRTTLATHPALVAEWKSKFAEVHVPSMLRTLDALISRDSVVARLGEIRVPALVIVGDEDRSLPPAYSRQIAAALPQASLLVVPGAGHLSNLEQPQAVTAAMLDFLQRATTQVKP
jgi:pimeloyl-ACP methyl ester carboxylesterase